MKKSPQHFSFHSFVEPTNQAMQPEQEVRFAEINIDGKTSRTRKHHHKTRTGCEGCKTRKIKVCRIPAHLPWRRSSSICAFLQLLLSIVSARRHHALIEIKQQCLMVSSVMNDFPAAPLARSETSPVSGRCRMDSRRILRRPHQTRISQPQRSLPHHVRSTCLQ